MLRIVCPALGHENVNILATLAYGHIATLSWASSPQAV